jgi:hypothetical protein
MIEKCKKICCKIWDMICWPFKKALEWMKSALPK